MSEEPALVTVAVDDLGMLLFATGAMKQIEAAMKNRSQDPFAPAPSKFREAHDRLAAQWRGAIREEPPSYDDPLTDAAIGIIHEIGMSPRGIEWTNLPALRELRQKGMVQLGSAHEAIYWGEGDQPELRGTGTARVRLTERGRAQWQKDHPGGEPDQKGSFLAVKPGLFKKLTGGD